MVATPPVTDMDADEVDAVVALIAAEQQQRQRLVTYLGTEAAGIRAELDGLEPPWTDTARVLRDETAGAISGAVVVEWDDDLGRAWILGPWVAGDDHAWAASADRLVDAALAELPATVTQFEVSGDVANTRLGELAARRGWASSDVFHILVADGATVAAWPPAAGDDGLRAAVPADATDIAPLHDIEFPGTYASAEQLVAGEADGSRVVLVAPAPTGEPGIAGYAAGQVHDDGEGFIDFVAVDPAARGGGVGGRLVRALTRQLLERSTTGQVGLTVQDSRQPARALYEKLGFRSEGSSVAYRSWTVG